MNGSQKVEAALTAFSKHLHIAVSTKAAPEPTECRCPNCAPTDWPADIKDQIAKEYCA